MHIEGFIKYLTKEKRMSKNSLEAYERDVMDFFAFEEEKGIKDLAETTNTEVVGYLLKLKNEGKSAATINRKLASTRSFFNYMQNAGIVSGNPTSGIKTPKVERKELEYLTIEEVDKLLDSPSENPRAFRVVIIRRTDYFAITRTTTRCITLELKEALKLPIG